MNDTMMAIFTRASALLRRFAGSRRGNVAMMFAIALVPMTIATGVGLDYARAALVKSQIADALDAAALAVGSSGLSSDKVAAAAQAYFDANYKGPGKATVSITNYDAKGSVTLSAASSVTTALLQVINQPTIAVQTSSTVVWGQSKLWVSLVLDNSGSMCEPDKQPCVDDTNDKSKIYQLKAATKTMLSKLQGASVNAGDVKVGIVPFNREVHVPFNSDGTTFSTSSAWIDWSFWAAAPANVKVSDLDNSNLGPGDDCPFGDSSNGFHCQKTRDNGSSSTSSIPSSGAYSGMICPSMDSGSKNTDRLSHYYNGCYISAGTDKQVSSGRNASCGSKSHCSCSGSGKNTVCTQTTYLHTWSPNAHSTWSGCITDRYSQTHGTPSNSKTADYDTQNIAPGSDTTGFTADNPSGGCPVAGVSALVNDSTSADVTALGKLVDKMQAAGSTNQAIGVAHAWQMLTKGDPYGTPALPANTSRYIILLSDGLNTQDRWWGDGHTEASTQDGYIDDRMGLTCKAAKADGVVIYTLYVHVNGGGNSDPLKTCATDDAHYYDLTTADAINAAFADIAQKITNVRVSQ